MEQFRNDSINKLNRFIKSKSKSKKIEESIFNYSTNSIEENSLDELYLINIYENKLNDILVNIDKKHEIGNTYLLKAIKKSELDLSNIANLKANKLFPDR